MTVYVVTSHYKEGKSIWVKSSAEAAEKWACGLILEDLDFAAEADILPGEDPQDVIVGDDEQEIIDYCNEGDYASARSAWFELQQKWGRNYIDDVTITMCDVDEANSGYESPLILERE